MALRAEEVFEVVKLLIGDIHAYGITEIDTINFNHLEQLEFLIELLTDEIIDEAQKKSCQYSIQESVEEAKWWIESTAKSFSYWQKEIKEWEKEKGD